MSIDDLLMDIVDLDEEIAERTAIRDALSKIYKLYDDDREKCRKEIIRFSDNFPHYLKPNIC